MKHVITNALLLLVMAIIYMVLAEKIAVHDREMERIKINQLNKIDKLEDTGNYLRGKFYEIDCRQMRLETKNPALDCAR